MRIERHEGFDRVSYYFGGACCPGWRAEYVAEATERGRSTSTSMSGRSILQIYFYDTASALESGTIEYNGPNPLTDPAARNVVEVVLTPSFERTTQSFLGIRADHPNFLVNTRYDPARVVVDIYG
ncbi:AMIN-like domain-containing (lipo)protein [Antrihabitans cavernicola]|uniref:AMIN-like domain-containing protein n=1 Tax=Antrihabitans cavernicola TaxID=2495913 RepID=A0A5A7S2N9_9NOCA|nr:hypothetical protein [Spelaeibacter cavernicola]KAA0016305.1 hypothetical protein FOY51_26490 [Spelaeibacter cavernicola]